MTMALPLLTSTLLADIASQLGEHALVLWDRLQVEFPPRSDVKTHPEWWPRLTSNSFVGVDTINTLLVPIGRVTAGGWTIAIWGGLDWCLRRVPSNDEDVVDFEQRALTTVPDDVLMAAFEKAHGSLDHHVCGTCRRFYSWLDRNRVARETAGVAKPLHPGSALPGFQGPSRGESLARGEQ